MQGKPADVPPLQMKVIGYLLKKGFEPAPPIPAVEKDGPQKDAFVFVRVDILHEQAEPSPVVLKIPVQRLQDARKTCPPEIRCRGLILSRRSRTASLNGQPLALTPQEFYLLYALMSAPDRVFTREELLKRAWRRDYTGDARTIDTHIKCLRAKLGREYAPWIVTLRKTGYMFQWPQDAASGTNAIHALK